MNKRKITNPFNVKFEPFDRYGAVVEKMSWHKISFNLEDNCGSYILKLEPGAKTTPHTHMGFEEFLILEGELIDADNTVFKKGDFVTFEPKSAHHSCSPTGCLVLVFMRGFNKVH